MTTFNTWKTRFDETATLLPSLKDLPIKERMVDKVDRALNACIGDLLGAPAASRNGKGLRLGAHPTVTFIHMAA